MLRFMVVKTGNVVRLLAATAIFLLLAFPTRINEFMARAVT